MKAAQITSFGAPDVLRVNDVDRPAPGAGEVLVSVEASSVNGHDTIVRAGGLRIMSGRRFPIGVGLDFAGVVVATGAGVDAHQVGAGIGDRVWGTVHPRKRHTVAAAAEYVAVPAGRVAAAPAGISSVEAASLVVAGATALLALRETVRLSSGERVLIRGAAGGVGTAAVQLAHASGGHVTALARDRHATALADLGADEVYDYTTTSAEQIGPFDVILDTVGSQLHRYRRRLTRNAPAASARSAPTPTLRCYATWPTTSPPQRCVQWSTACTRWRTSPWHIRHSSGAAWWASTSSRCPAEEIEHALRTVERRCGSSHSRNRRARMVVPDRTAIDAANRGACPERTLAPYADACPSPGVSALTEFPGCGLK